MVAEIWENNAGNWFGQLVDEATGRAHGGVFEESSRGGVIATMAQLYQRSTFPFRDRIRPTEF